MTLKIKMLGVAFLTLSVLLTACGGGGSGTTPPAPVPPEVVKTIPADGLDVFNQSSIVVQFSKDIDGDTVDETSVLVVDSATDAVAGFTLETFGEFVYLRPPVGGWPTAATPLSITLTTAIEDLSGLGLVSDYLFTVVPSPTPPPLFEVVTQTPADASFGVAVDTNISVTFSTAVDFSTVASGVKLYDEVRQVPGSWSVSADNLTVTFAPDLPLATDVVSYSLEFGPALTSLAGEPLLGAPIFTAFDTVVSAGSWVEPAFSSFFNYNRTYSVAVDASGNIYLAGSTGATRAVRDAFVTKVAADGTEQWTRQFNINGADDGYAVAVDRYGFVYLAGSTDVDGFVLRLPATGSTAAADGYWLKEGVASEAFEEFFGVTTDWSGNVFAVGYADDNVQSDPLIVKLRASDGAVLGTDRIAATSGHLTESAISAAYDPVSDSIFVCGDFEGDIGIVSSFGGIDAFVVKYQSDASAQTFSRKAVQIFGSPISEPSDQFGVTVATGPSGEVVLGGGSDAKVVADGTQTFDGVPPVGFFVGYNGSDLSATSLLQELSDGITVMDEEPLLGLAVDGFGLVYAAGIVRDDFEAPDPWSDHGYVLQYDQTQSVGSDYQPRYLKPLVQSDSAIGSDVETTPTGALVFLGTNEIDETNVLTRESSGDPVLRLYDNTMVLQ